MQKITPHLWYDTQAEDAAKLYVSLFKDSRILRVDHYGEQAAKASGNKLGSVMTVTFQLEGQEYVALNGGPAFSLNPSVSFMVKCENQKEIDKLWDRLIEGGGEENQCGWLRDRYGLSWQIVPSSLDQMLRDKEPSRSERVWAALLQMRKIDIEALRKAYDQK
jgi:predicted 3-demethylubiquinone-9 3-methyltransferase (glyoxalase superfamily)